MVTHLKKTNFYTKKYICSLHFYILRFNIAIISIDVFLNYLLSKFMALILTFNLFIFLLILGLHHKSRDTITGNRIGKLLLILGSAALSIIIISISQCNKIK
jgi:hypothetical protein